MVNVNKIQCKAKSKRSGERCKNYCSPGKVVCKWHGGASNGAPKGNKNAIKIGQYEKILLGEITKEEQLLIDTMDISSVAMLEQEIKVVRVREARILRRIAIALEKERLAGQPTGEIDGNGREKRHATMVSVSSTTTRGGESGTVNVLHQEAHSVYIMKAEATLTSVQAHLARLIAQREGLIAASGVNKGGTINLFIGGKSDER